MATYWNSKRELWLGTGKRNSGHVRRRLPRWVAVHGWHDLRWGHALRERDGAVRVVPHDDHRRVRHLLPEAPDDEDHRQLSVTSM